MWFRTFFTIGSFEEIHPTELFEVIQEATSHHSGKFALPVGLLSLRIQHILLRQQRSEGAARSRLIHEHATIHGHNDQFSRIRTPICIAVVLSRHPEL
jgi:hypothetical protein